MNGEEVRGSSSSSHSNLISIFGCNCLRFSTVNTESHVHWAYSRGSLRLCGFLQRIKMSKIRKSLQFHPSVVRLPLNRRNQRDWIWVEWEPCMDREWEWWAEKNKWYFIIHLGFVESLYLVSTCAIEPQTDVKLRSMIYSKELDWIRHLNFLSSSVPSSFIPLWNHYRRTIHLFLLLCSFHVQSNR